MVRPSSTIFLSCLLVILIASPTRSLALTQESASLISNSVGLTTSLLGCSGLLNKASTNRIASSVTKSVPITNSTADKREDCYDKVAYNVASRLLDRITQATINWTNSGFDKKGPFYVENQRSYLDGIQNDIIRRGVTASSKDPIGQKFLKQLLDTTNSSLEANLRGTQNAQDRRFASGQSFSWTGWQRMILIDTNNPLGYAIKATNLINKEKSTQVGIATQELLQGQGFKPFRKCVAPTDYKSISSSDQKNLEYKIKALLDVVNSGGIDKTAISEELDADGNITYVTKPRSYSTNELNQAQTELARLQKELARGICKQWETQTPGSFIAHKLEKGADVQTDRLLFINKASQSLGLVVDAALNGVMKWGLKSLSNENASYLANLPQNAQNQTQQLFQSQSEEALQKIGTRYTYDRNGQILTTTKGVLAEQKDVIVYLEQITENNNGNWALFDQINYWSNMADFCIPGPMPDRITELGETLNQKIEGYNNQVNTWWGQIVSAVDVLGITGAFQAGNAEKIETRYSLYAAYIHAYYETDGDQYTPTTIDGKTNTAGLKLYANMPDIKRVIYPIIRQAPDREEDKKNIRNTITEIQVSVAQLKQICIAAKAVYTGVDSAGNVKYQSQNYVWKNIECI